MLTEQSAYANRWRKVTPAAKGIFALCGMLAAFSACSARAALTVALIMSCTTILGAHVPLLRYLRVAAPALFFLLASGLSLAVSLDFGAAPPAGILLHLTPSQLPRVTHICSRSLACLTALLFLTMTTPLTDIMYLLRRCRVPDTLLDLMTLCYRTLFILSEATRETMVAQSARLGYSTIRISLRSLGGMIASLAIQVWQRSQALHLAAQARNNDGALHFLTSEFPDAHRSISIAAGTGALMIVLTLSLP